MSVIGIRVFALSYYQKIHWKQFLQITEPTSLSARSVFRAISAVRKAVVKRWRLEIKPEDKEKYIKGELVEPIQPIIFYIDRNTPEKYIGCIIEAVRDWRPAFEQAGFKNAIDARLAPTAEEDPDFSLYDSTHPVS